MNEDPAVSRDGKRRESEVIAIGQFKFEAAHVDRGSGGVDDLDKFKSCIGARWIVQDFVDGDLSAGDGGDEEGKGEQDGREHAGIDEAYSIHDQTSSSGPIRHRLEPCTSTKANHIMESVFLSIRSDLETLASLESGNPFQCVKDKWPDAELPA